MLQQPSTPNLVEQEKASHKQVTDSRQVKSIKQATDSHRVERIKQEKDSRQVKRVKQEKSSIRGNRVKQETDSLRVNFDKRFTDTESNRQAKLIKAQTLLQSIINPSSLVSDVLENLLDVQSTPPLAELQFMKLEGTKSGRKVRLHSAGDTERFVIHVADGRAKGRFGNVCMSENITEFTVGRGKKATACALLSATFGNEPGYMCLYPDLAHIEGALGAGFQATPQDAVDVAGIEVQGNEVCLNTYETFITLLFRFCNPVNAAAHCDHLEEEKLLDEDLSVFLVSVDRIRALKKLVLGNNDFGEDDGRDMSQRLATLDSNQGELGFSQGLDQIPAYSMEKSAVQVVDLPSGREVDQAAWNIGVATSVEHHDQVPGQQSCNVHHTLHTRLPKMLHGSASNGENPFDLVPSLLQENSSFLDKTSQHPNRADRWSQIVANNDANSLNEEEYLLMD